MIFKFWWLYIALVSLLTYFPVIDDFFGWDDFLWLYRAKTLFSDPAQMFQSEGLYFDPLVYLAFWFDYQLFGLDYRWYHLTDIAIHVINGTLLFYFTRLYSENDLLALVSSLIFASTFAASDAVLWSSSRVDLLSTLFSLASLILFLKYLKEGRTLLYLVSIILFALALGAKVTPIVLPILFCWIYLKNGIQKGYKIIVPFVLLVLLYLLLLLSVSANSPLGRTLYPNIYNYSMALTSLFIPEALLAKLNLLINPIYVFLLVYCLLLIVWRMKLSPSMDQIKSTALFMTFLSLTPLLILSGEPKLATPDNIYHILGSPSHRIYLASTGMSMFLGSIILSFYEKLNTKKEIIIIVVLFMLSFNIRSVWLREQLWDIGTTRIKESVYNLRKVKPYFSEGSVVVTINFPMSGVFLEPILKIYYDIKDVRVTPMKYIPTELADGVAAFGKRYELFLKGDTLLIGGSLSEINDLSEPFKELLSKAYSYHNTTDQLEKMEYKREYIALAGRLNQDISKFRGKLLQ